MKTTIKHLVFSHVLIGLLLNLSVVYAQDAFQTQIETGYISFEDDGDIQSEIYALIIQQHFSSVNISNHPFSEAAFLERVGSAGVFYGIQEMSFGPTRDADGALYGAAVTYMKPGFPIVVDAMFAKSDATFDPPVDGDLTVDAYGLKIGVFMRDGFLIGVGYTRRKLESSGASLNNGIFENNIYELHAKFVNKFNDGTAINIESEIGVIKFDDPNDDGSNIQIDLSGDYYFNQRISLGAGVGVNTGDDKDDEGKNFSVDVNMFMGPFFSVAFEFEKFLADNTEGEDEKTFEIVLLTRF